MLHEKMTNRSIYKPSHYRARYYVIRKSEKSLTALEKFRDELQQKADKSQDNFETQISYIAAGAIAVTVAFLSDVVPLAQAAYKVFIITGWTLLISSLFFNLYSHVITFKKHRETI